MIEGDTFQPIKKLINKVDTIIHDPFLSQFKYHFIIRKLPILYIIADRVKWPQFINNLYKGFNTHFMGHNSVHIAQILNIYQQSGSVDLIIGLRRDQHAIKIYREGSVFEYGGQKFQVQVAQGFKTYLDELNQKYRIQAAQRQKLRAEQNQSTIKIQQNTGYKSPIIDQKLFNRLISNSISHIRQSVDKISSSQEQQQGQIIDSDKKSQHRKNSSDRSYESKCSNNKSYQLQAKKVVSVSKQIESKNIYNRDDLYIQSRSSKKRNPSKSKSSRSYSSRSSSSPSYKKSHTPKIRDRSSRERYRNIKRESSNSSSYSQKSQQRKYSKGQRYYGNVGVHVRRRSPIREYRHVEDRRRDQNQKYQLPQTFDRVNSYNNRGYSQQLITPEFNRKYSHQQYRQPNRGDEYYEHNKPQQSYYYKHAQDYSSYHRYPSAANEEQNKSQYRGNTSRKNQNNYRGQNNAQ